MWLDERRRATARAEAKFRLVSTVLTSRAVVPPSLFCMPNEPNPFLGWVYKRRARVLEREINAAAKTQCVPHTSPCVCSRRVRARPAPWLHRMRRCTALPRSPPPSNSCPRVESTVESSLEPCCHRRMVEPQQHQAVVPHRTVSVSNVLSYTKHLIQASYRCHLFDLCCYVLGSHDLVLLCPLNTNVCHYVCRLAVL